MSISTICIALLGILLLLLAVAVSGARGKFDILYSNPTDPEHMLYKLIRAHCNTVEYAPALMIIIYILGQTNQSTWILWFMGIVTFSRYLIVVGIVFPKSLAIPNAMRFLGALGTYICGLGLCMALFQQGLNL